MKKGSFAKQAALAACLVFSTAATANAAIPNAAITAMERPITLATKYVAYSEADGTPVISKQAAEKVIEHVNEVYATCSIHFALEEFVVAHPSEQGLRFRPTSMRELDPIRKSFDEKSRLVIVNTGKWDQAGGLGADGANAWTMMPGEKPSGTVIEAPHVSNANLVAHELGHYLNLDHAHDKKNLMNPVIYRASTSLDPAQCAALRQAAMGPKHLALRTPSFEEDSGRMPASAVASQAGKSVNSGSSLAASAKE